MEIAKNKIIPEMEDCGCLPSSNYYHDLPLKPNQTELIDAHDAINHDHGKFIPSTYWNPSQSFAFVVTPQGKSISINTGN